MFNNTEATEHIAYPELTLIGKTPSDNEAPDMIIVGVCNFSLSKYFMPECIICDVKPSVLT